MRVAVLSYPMLFQAQEGLQIQILETNAALQRLGVDARLISPNIECLTERTTDFIFAAYAE